MKRNANVTETEGLNGRVMYQCNGCGTVYTAHGVRAHQSGRFTTGACRPMMVDAEVTA
ncbi:hypothetical protein I5H01_gp026 [Mycobacterium phage MarkPhew]|uniref:C2H2-type domain-containing protein n=1 Tax=Mycobacterium phage MarkPhew TaxID=2725625 RepID=A0A6M3T8N3_9CAUD|nr:hypothetical protein I5H01_gp026 [Mycobacterium phage MarkPhew]QJD50381.1 hypothetical protein SEA_MARKPHEW_81 [Mycobacterium phage MarkPhew]